MKIENFYLKYALIALGFFFTYGVVLPFLISAASDFLVSVGIILLILSIYFLIRVIKNAIADYQNQQILRSINPE